MKELIWGLKALGLIYVVMGTVAMGEYTWCLIKRIRDRRKYRELG